jgi:hypothetical protein
VAISGSVAAGCEGTVNMRVPNAVAQAAVEAGKRGSNNGSSVTRTQKALGNGFAYEAAVEITLNPYDNPTNAFVGG